ncbi:MAG: hypothetical protein I3273_00800 [Candidatus Moeniiplasma glomeromycotorum]|nr:hypothetical protein [Candidatus Moeniiplasma glomeromycotorum]MCE8167338.1 hypothetical protein [Candidatus Moeniiplasma glomeromycotorum]MCE8168649.1 hypothetical protein [Candidatus Moeniiplasma glomeromycotorum]
MIVARVWLRDNYARNDINKIDNSGRTYGKVDLEGDLVIDGYPNVTEIHLKGASSANKIHLNSLTIRNCPRLINLVVENNNLTNLDITGVNTLTNLDISDNAGLTALDLTNALNLRQIDLHGCNLLNPGNIRGLGGLNRLRFWNGGMMLGGGDMEPGTEKPVVPFVAAALGADPKQQAVAEIEALRAHVGLADADFKAELRKPIADGGANAATEADGDAGTRSLRDTGDDNQDWKNWLTLAADTDAETNPKKEAALRILRRRQAVARVNAELGTLTNDDLKNRINDATGLPGSIGANTIQLADSWKVWMDKAPDLDTVYAREDQLIKAITYLKAGGQNRKVIAFEEVEALRAHVGLADADFKAELRKPIADGGANAATEADGDAGTRSLRDTGDDNQDWKNWLTLAADTDAETNPKKEAALRILRRRQAVARVNAELGTLTNDDLKNRINDATGLPGSIGANTIQLADSWKVWMDKAPDLDTVYAREDQLIKAITYLKAGGQNRKVIAFEEVEALRAHVGLADADFKAELRKPIADGGANAATEADGDAGTRSLRDTGDDNQDWKNWLTLAADTDAETNPKKANALKILRRYQYASNIADEVEAYLTDPATGAKTDADLNAELNRPLGTGGGQALGIEGAGPANWKAWLREAINPHQALERGLLAMKAVVIIKNADKKVSEKLLEASLAKIELYRKAHQDYKGTALNEIGYDNLIEALVNEGADDGADGFNGGRDKAAFVNWMGKPRTATWNPLTWYGTGREAQEVKDIEIKEEFVLTVIARKRAITRLETLRTTLGVSHEDFVKRLKQAPNQGGISANAALDETAAEAEASWHSLFNGLNKVELVTSKETEMAQSLGVAKGGVAGGGDLKAAAIAEVEAAFNAAHAAFPTSAHTVFKTELNTSAAAAIADTATDDNVAWHAWLNTATDTPNQTAIKKAAALKIIAVRRALYRIVDRLGFGKDTTTAALNTELQKADGDGGGVGNLSYNNYINNAADIEEVAEREGKVMRAIGILKAGGGAEKTRADGYANDITEILTGMAGTTGTPPANWKAKLTAIKNLLKDNLGFDPDSPAYVANLNQLINDIKTKLGTSKLTDITTGNLTDLINKPDTSALTTQLSQEKQKVVDFETKLGTTLDKLADKLGAKKLSDIPDSKTLEDLINADPTALQTEIDSLKTQLTDKEKTVVKEIHDELQLGLAEGSITKQQVLDKIRALIADKGGEQEITRLKTELENLKNQPDRIVKEVVVEKIKDNSEAQQTYGFTFTPAEQEKIEAAVSAKDALALTNEIIKGKMETLQSSKKTANTLNWVLGTLSVASLVALAYLLLKGNSGLLSDSEEKKEGEK